GAGAMIDLSQGEAMSAYLGEYFLEAQLAGAEPERPGNAHPSMSPHGVYRCAGDDAWIAIGARDEAEWRAMANTAGCGWADDPRFAGIEARREHRDALDAAIGEWTRTQDQVALMRALLAAGTPAGAVYSAPQMLGDPHLEARGYFAELETVDAGRSRFDGSPLLFDGARGYEGWRGAPGLGEHNVAVLEQLGMTAQEIANLQEADVIVDAPPSA
ncbi:MAG: CoA transferase, partial [Dehalococcoidia bacterium]